MLLQLRMGLVSIEVETPIYSTFTALYICEVRALYSHFNIFHYNFRRKCCTFYSTIFIYPHH